MTNTASKKTRIIFTLKLIVGVSLLGFLFNKVNFSLLVDVIVSALPIPFIFGLLFYGIALIADILKFRSACRNALSIGESARLVLVGLLYNNFLPSNVGGDTYIMLRMRRFNIPASKGIFYILSNRLIGLVALFTLGAGAVLFSSSARQLLLNLAQRFDISMHIVEAWFIVGFVIALFLITVIIFRRFSHRLRSMLHHGMNTLYDHVRNAALRTFIFATMYQLSRAAAMVCIASSFGGRISLSVVLVVMVSVGIVTMLPISLGGLGVREGTLSFLLYQAGLPLEIAATIALVNLLVLWVKSLAGLSIFMMNEKRQETT